MNTVIEGAFNFPGAGTGLNNRKNNGIEGAL
jgi:hypothetical protein